MSFFHAFMSELVISDLSSVSWWVKETRPWEPTHCRCLCRWKLGCMGAPAFPYPCSHLQFADLPISFRSSWLNNMAVTSSGEVRNRRSWFSQSEHRSLHAYSKETGSAVTSHGLYAIQSTDLGKQRYDCCLLPVTRYCKNKPSPHPCTLFNLAPQVKNVRSHFGSQLHPPASTLFVARKFYIQQKCNWILPCVKILSFLVF